MTIQTESFGRFLPDKRLLKQLALYMDKVIVNDPIFGLTCSIADQSRAVNEYLGCSNGDEINRDSLVKAVKYMKMVSPMVAYQYLKFSPMSYIHEPPKEIPVCFSKNAFEDVLPENIIKFFKDNATVVNMEKIENGGWRLLEDSKLELGRAIAINFEKNNFNHASMYFLFESKVLEFNKSTGKLKFVHYIPDEKPSKEEFDIWVKQSINRSAQGYYNELYNEVYNAELMGSSYLTTSEFTAKLLNKEINNTLNSDVANLLLNLNLPIIEKKTIDEIMDIREKDGEAFKNFRISLRQQLKKLRGITDEEKLRIELENIEQEITEVQVNEVNKKIETVKRQAMSDMVILGGSLAATIQTNGISLLGAALALIKGCKDLQKYRTEVKSNPGYFLWRIKNNNFV